MSHPLYGNRHGNTVVIALIIMVMSAVIGLAVGELAMTTRRTGEAGVGIDDFNLLINQLRNLTSREESCRALFGGPTTWFGSSYWLTTAPVIFAPGYGVGSTSNALKLYYPAVGVATPTPFLKKNSTFGKLTITNLTMKITGTVASSNPTYEPSLYQATMNIQATLPAGAPSPSSTSVSAAQLSGGSLLSDYSSVNLTLGLNADGTLGTCSGVSFFPQSGGSSQPLPICAPGSALYSDGTTVKCITVLCPPNSTRDSYGSGGNYHCS